MNAGTPAGCMADHLLSVEVAEPDGLRWIDAAALKLSYRHCELPVGAVLARARCRVRRGAEGDLLEQQRVAKADVDRRRATQPLNLPNSGSVFVNPQGNFAGRLIEQVGLKGTVAGGAQISDRHANFIVNLGGAKAAQVRRAEAERDRAAWRSVAAVALRTLAAAAVSGALTFGSWQAWRWATASAAFSIHEIRFSGLAHAQE